MQMKAESFPTWDFRYSLCKLTLFCFKLFNIQHLGDPWHPNIFFMSISVSNATCILEESKKAWELWNSCNMLNYIGLENFKAFMIMKHVTQGIACEVSGIEGIPEIKSITKSLHVKEQICKAPQPFWFYNGGLLLKWCPQL